MKTPFVSVALPRHVDRLIGEQWTRSVSLRIDRVLVQTETRYAIEVQGVEL